jgi:hypothetical protein
MAVAPGGEGHDVCDKNLHRPVSASLDLFVGKQGIEALDLIHGEDVGVKCKCQCGRLANQRLIISVLWLDALSMTIWMSRSFGTFRSTSARNARNSFRINRNLARTRHIFKALQAIVSVAPAPQAHNARLHAHLLSNRARAATLRRQQNNPRSFQTPLNDKRRSAAGLKLLVVAPPKPNFSGFLKSCDTWITNHGP